MRALPPADLSVGSLHEGNAAVAWSGSEWGISWAENPGGEPAVFFARVGIDGHRRGKPTRLSELGHRSVAPALVWNGESWVVAFSGGPVRNEEICLCRIDAHGVPMGRPQRLTSRDRHDLVPALAFNGRDLLGVWTAAVSDEQYVVYALRMNRWGSQASPPMKIANRQERLSSPTATWNGGGWAVAWLVSRNEAVAVDMARLDTAANPWGYPTRVTHGPLGGTDLLARFGIAWNGTQYALAWDEVRDGAPHVFFNATSPQLDREMGTVMLSAAADSAKAPALATLADDTFIAAWEVERGIDRHVQLVALDPAGTALGESIEIQGHDGRAESPTLAIGSGSVGLATVSQRGVSFHHVPLGPCQRGSN